MITAHSLRNICREYHGAYEDTPFGPDTLTMKVMGKVFAFIPLDTPDTRIAVKGTPERISELREQYADVVKGAYLNSKHWTTIICNGDVPPDVLYAAIAESYRLVVKGLTRMQRAELASLP